MHASETPFTVMTNYSNQTLLEAKFTSKTNKTPLINRKLENFVCVLNSSGSKVPFMLCLQYVWQNRVLSFTSSQVLS